MTVDTERQLFVLTDSDREKAAAKNDILSRDLAEVEARRADKAYWKRRRTTFGLAKRDLCARLLAGDPEYAAGRGQALLDRLHGLDYASERKSAAYNSGYYAGWQVSFSSVRDYLERNDNFAGLGEEIRQAIHNYYMAAR